MNPPVFVANDEAVIIRMNRAQQSLVKWAR